MAWVTLIGFVLQIAQMLIEISIERGRITRAQREILSGIIIEIDRKLQNVQAARSRLSTDPGYADRLRLQRRIGSGDRRGEAVPPEPDGR